MLTDEDAYKLYINGDEDGAAVLVERYGDALIKYINGYIHDLADAEDLMIEAFTRIFAKERPISSADSMFKAYLYKTARNLALRHRLRRRMNILSTDDVDFELAGDDSAHAAVFRDERDRLLASAMDKLRGEYREALYLVYFEEMSYREAARVMKRSEAQLTKLVYRGKQRLKTLLTEEGFDHANE